MAELHLHNDYNAWDRYVGNDVEYKFYKFNQETKISESGNIFVFLATFIGLHPDGSINVTNNASTNFLASESFFINSFSTERGGSINVEYGSCIQYHICSINSTISHQYGCHSHVITTDEKENYIIESSISKSSGCRSCIHIFYGDQLIDSTNISYAKCVDDSAAYFCGYPSSHRINFTSIINNTADEYNVMVHEECNQYVYRCNVINNTQNRKEFSNGIVYNWVCNLQISFCVFSSNSGLYLCYNDGGNFVIDQCFLDNPNVDEVYVDELITTNQLVLNLHHLSTQECFADFPRLSHVKKQIKTSSKSKLIAFRSSLFLCSQSE